MAPPPGYVASQVWHADFPPQSLLDSTTTAEGETVEWRTRSKAQDRDVVAAWFAVSRRDRLAGPCSPTACQWLAITQQKLSNRSAVHSSAVKLVTGTH